MRKILGLKVFLILMWVTGSVVYAGSPEQTVSDFYKFYIQSDQTINMSQGNISQLKAYLDKDFYTEYTGIDRVAKSANALWMDFDPFLGVQDNKVTGYEIGKARRVQESARVAVAIKYLNFRGQGSVADLWVFLINQGGKWKIVNVVSLNWDGAFDLRKFMETVKMEFKQ